jgi:hypothetical protein
LSTKSFKSLRPMRMGSAVSRLLGLICAPLRLNGVKMNTVVTPASLTS